VTRDPRRVPLKLHSALEMAAALLDLPLTSTQLEGLALELTGPVRALIAEALAEAGDDSPVRYAVTSGEPTPDAPEFEESEYAGCITRVGLDVDLDSPAGTLAAKCRRQPDVTALELRDAHTIGVTVVPQSLDAWRWWLFQLGVDPSTVVMAGTVATATGCKDGVTVHLSGDDVPELYADRGAAALMCLIAPARA